MKLLVERHWFRTALWLFVRPVFAPERPGFDPRPERFNLRGFQSRLVRRRGRHERFIVVADDSCNQFARIRLARCNGPECSVAQVEPQICFAITFIRSMTGEAIL